MRGDRLRTAVLAPGCPLITCPTSGGSPPGRGAGLRAHDPAAGDNARHLLPDLVVVSTPEEALRGADAAVISTDWPIYRDLDWVPCARQRVAR